MKIELKKQDKAELLKALSAGVLDTDTIPELKKVLDAAQPARVLTKAEAKDLITNLEKEC